MNTERPSKSPTRKPPLLRWLAWGVLLLIGGTIVAAVVSAFVDVASYGVDPRKLPFLIAIVIWFVLFFCLKAATNPIRGRGDERRACRPPTDRAMAGRLLRRAGRSLVADGTAEAAAFQHHVLRCGLRSIGKSLGDEPACMVPSSSK